MENLRNTKEQQIVRHKTSRRPSWGQGAWNFLVERFFVEFDFLQLGVPEVFLGVLLFWEKEEEEQEEKEKEDGFEKKLTTPTRRVGNTVMVRVDIPSKSKWHAREGERPGTAQYDRYVAYPAGRVQETCVS